jgi:hypothetical protein
MTRPPFLRTVYLVVNDFGQSGRAFVETDIAEADRETIVRNFITGQYSDAIRVVAFNTAEGWSRDVSEDIALEILQRAFDADQVVGEDTRHFINRHVSDRSNPAPMAPPSPINLADELKPGFEKRPPAASVRRGPIYRVKRRPGDTDR